MKVAKNPATPPMVKGSNADKIEVKIDFGEV